MKALLDEALPCKLVRLLRDAGCTVEPFPIEATGIALVVLPMQALDILESNLQQIVDAIAAARIGEALAIRFPERR